MTYKAIKQPAHVPAPLQSQDDRCPELINGSHYEFACKFALQGKSTVTIQTQEGKEYDVKPRYYFNVNDIEVSKDWQAGKIAPSIGLIFASGSVPFCFRTLFIPSEKAPEIIAGSNLRASCVEDPSWRGDFMWPYSSSPNMGDFGVSGIRYHLLVSSDKGSMRAFLSTVDLHVKIKDDTFMDRFRTGSRDYLNRISSVKKQLVDPNQDERKQDQKRESVSPTSWLPSAAASSATASASPASAALASLPKVEGTGVNLRPMNINLAKGEKRRARLKAQAKARAKGQPFKRRS